MVQKSWFEHMLMIVKNARNEQNLTKLNPKMDGVLRLCWVT